MAQAKSQFERMSDAPAPSLVVRAGRQTHLDAVAHSQLVSAPRGALRCLEQVLCQRYHRQHAREYAVAGRVFPGLHEDAEKITTRESAIALVKETTAELCKAIDAVNAENIHSTPNSPFGPMAMPFWMYQGHDHMAGHTGQLEYLQTIWGDLDNHFAN